MNAHANRRMVTPPNIEQVGTDQCVGPSRDVSASDETSAAGRTTSVRPALLSAGSTRVFHHPLRPDLGAVHMALRVGGDAFGRARAAEIGTLARFGIGDEVLHGAVFRAADSQAAPPAIVVARDRLRFGIGDVNIVLLVDEDAARTAELLPLGDELAVLIEDLDAVVIAIADEEAFARIHRERVRLIEFTGRGAELAPLLDELAGLVELQDAVVARTVTLGHEDVAVGCHQHVVRLIEVVGRRRAARFAEREEYFALWAELVNLIAFR